MEKFEGRVSSKAIWRTRNFPMDDNTLRLKIGIFLTCRI